MIELAKQMKIWNEDSKRSPNVGDIIMYDWDNQDGWPEHVGIVESVTNNQITAVSYTHLCYSYLFLLSTTKL